MIYIIDVTNRDGVQTSKLGLAKLEKTLLKLYLDEMGVFQSEFGFPVTRHETNYLNANLELEEIGALKRIRLGGWMRAIKEDVEEAREILDLVRYARSHTEACDRGRDEVHCKIS